MSIRGDVNRIRHLLRADGPDVCPACRLSAQQVRVLKIGDVDGAEVERLLALLPKCDLCGLLLPPIRTVHVDDDGRPFLTKIWPDYRPPHMWPGVTEEDNRIYAPPAGREPEHDLTI